MAGYRLRDGRSLRQGMLFRSGALDRATAADRDLLLGPLAVRTILDLRHPDEVADPASGDERIAARRIAHSIFPETGTQAGIVEELNGLYGPGISPARYLHYLEIGGHRFAEAVTLMADPEAYPLLVHCTAGKDRTGVLVALVMDVLGAGDDDIAAEYGLSDAGTDALIAYLRETGRVLEGDEDEIRARLATPPDRMTGFLHGLRERHGGAAAFLLAAGTPASALDALPGLLTQG